MKFLAAAITATPRKRKRTCLAPHVSLRSTVIFHLVNKDEKFGENIPKLEMLSWRMICTYFFESFMRTQVLEKIFRNTCVGGWESLRRGMIIFKYIFQDKTPSGKVLIGLIQFL